MDGGILRKKRCKTGRKEEGRQEADNNKLCREKGGGCGSIRLKDTGHDVHPKRYGEGKRAGKEGGGVGGGHG